MTRIHRLKLALQLLGFFVLFGLYSSWAHAQSPSLVFTLETSSPDGKTVVPRLTWSTTPAANSCTASGWTPPAPFATTGTTLLAAVSASQTYGIACTWNGVTKFAITRVAPTENTDGSPLTDLAGFRVKYGTSATNLATTVTLNDPAARGWTSPDLAVGNRFAGVIAFNSLGLDSDLSNVTSKTLSASANQNRALELTIRFPKPPTGVQ
jgi:hypothetical protein